MCATCGCNHINYKHGNTDPLIKFKNSSTTRSMNLKVINNFPKVPKIKPMPRTMKRGNR